MTKFKVGDIVKGKPDAGFRAGVTMEILGIGFKSVLGKYDYLVTGGVGMSEDELELVKSAKETYEVGKWYGWNGGECPVEDETIVDLIWGAYGSVSYETNERADSWSWKVDEDTAPIVAFRVVSKANPPVFVGWVDGVFVQDSLFFEGATHKIYEDMSVEEL